MSDSFVADSFAPDNATPPSGGDSFAPDSGTDYTPGGLGANAVKNAIRYPTSMFQNAKNALYDTPKAILNTIQQKRAGMPFAQTDLGQKMIDSATDILPAAHNAAQSVLHPVDWAYENPIDAAMLAYGGYQGAKSVLSSAPGALANEAGEVSLGAPTPPPSENQSTATPGQPSPEQALPNYLEQKGAANLNYATGIRGKTVEMMTPPGQNPGTVGVSLAKRMSDENALGSTPIETWQKASGVANQYGKAVGSAYDAIDQANQAAGGESGDALTVDANSHLKPILDEANKLRDLKNYPEQVKTGRYLYKTYSRLADVANQNDGNLTLNDVHSELQQVGKLYSPTNENIIDPVYSRLMKLQNDMVSDVADRAGDDTLKSNLLKANEGYSTYMRILPDISRAAANSSVGQQSMSSMLSDLKGAVTGQGPIGGRAVLALGRGAPNVGAAAQGSQVPLFSKGIFTKEER